MKGENDNPPGKPFYGFSGGEKVVNLRAKMHDKLCLRDFVRIKKDEQTV